MKNVLYMDNAGGPSKRAAEPVALVFLSCPSALALKLPALSVCAGHAGCANQTLVLRAGQCPFTPFCTRWHATRPTLWVSTHPGHHLTAAAVAGEAAGLSLGLLCAGSGTEKAAELLAYAHETQARGKPPSDVDGFISLLHA